MLTLDSTTVAAASSSSAKMPTSAVAGTCTVKYQGKVLKIASGLAFEVKLAASPLTGLSPRAMKLLHKGKVLASADTVPANATLMLLRQPDAAGQSVTIDLHEIVTGAAHLGVRVPAAATHDELVDHALRMLNLSTDGEAVCLRFYLPHLGSLMRVDLTLADYAAGTPEGKRLVVFLVPCPPGLRNDAATSEAEALARAEEVAAHARLRAQAEAEAEAEAVQIALQQMMLPPSLVEAAALEEESSSAKRSGEPAAATAGASEEDNARAACEAAGVPTRIRTGLMPAAEDVPFTPPSAELVAELEALEAYDAEMRELGAMPYAQAREMLIGLEESRLEERCAMLVSSLPAVLAEDAHAYGPPPHESPLPSTPLQLQFKKTLQTCWSGLLDLHRTRCK